MIQLKYRPDIDGLRAIAVLSVVVYHAFPCMIPGGFTGVDIFFVISGILYKGLKANGGSGQMLKCLGKNKKITVVLSIPTAEIFSLNKYLARSFHGVLFTRPKAPSEPEMHKFVEGIDKQIASIALANNADVIYPFGFLSTNGICILENEQGPIRYDNSHLREGFVRERITNLDQTVAP